MPPLLPRACRCLNRSCACFVSFRSLGALIDAVLEHDFDRYVAERASPQGGHEISYSELVQLLLTRAEQPPFRAQYLQAFCLDLGGPVGATADGVAPSTGVPAASPPPSPPMAATAAGAVGAFVWLDTYKAVLLRKVWIVGLLCALTAAALVTTSTSASGVGRRLTFLLANLVHLVASLVGWWTCQNKKDDLNTMRSLAEMRSQLQRLEKAEGRLRGALDAMAVSGAEMDDLDAEIDAAFATAQSQLARIRDEQRRRREGTKAHTLTNVLMKFVNMDDRPYWYDSHELTKLHNMICAMTGEPNTPLEVEMHGEMRRVLLAEKLVPGKEYLAEAVPPLLTDQLPGNQVLAILVKHKAFEMIMNLPLEDETRSEGRPQAGAPREASTDRKQPVANRSLAV